MFLVIENYRLSTLIYMNVVVLFVLGITNLVQQIITFSYRIERYKFFCGGVEASAGEVFPTRLELVERTILF